MPTLLALLPFLPLKSLKHCCSHSALPSLQYGRRKADAYCHCPGRFPFPFSFPTMVALASLSFSEAIGPNMYSHSRRRRTSANQRNASRNARNRAPLCAWASRCLASPRRRLSASFARAWLALLLTALQCIEVEMTSKLAMIAESLCMCASLHAPCHLEPHSLYHCEQTNAIQALPFISRLSLSVILTPSYQWLRYLREEVSLRRSAHHQLAQGAFVTPCFLHFAHSSQPSPPLQNLERDTTNRYGPNSFKLYDTLDP
jgi:hypothetical protein